MPPRTLGIGDILMLSQQAWNIGRAFSQGKSSAPANFVQVEREANALSETLKSTAQTLHDDSSLLSSADPHVLSAVNDILESVGNVLSDLEAFVDSYQVIRKRETHGGFVVERTWAEDMLESYGTVTWTTYGANISDVQNLLPLLAKAVNSTIQALQSGSLDTQEQVVVRIAQAVESVQRSTEDDVRTRIDDLRRQLTLIGNETSFAKSRKLMSAEDQATAGARKSAASALRDGVDRLAELQITHTVTSRSPRFEPLEKADSLPHDSVHSTPALAMTRGFDPVSPQNDRHEVSLREGGRYGGGSSLLRRESTTLPDYRGQIATEAEDIGAPRHDHWRATGQKASLSSHARPETFLELESEAVLPPPYVEHSPHEEQSRTPATPSSLSKLTNRDRGDSTTSPRPLTYGTPGSPRTKAEPPSTALASLPAFERLLFRNAAILCDVRGKLVEYARKIPDEVDPRYDTEMVEACKDCRICIIRKRENRPHGGTRVVTSIWAMSEDGVVRCRQKLSDSIETVPYCSYFEHEKVSIPPTEGQMTLEFHGEDWGDELEQQVQTNWVNYFLSSESDAIAFQSAVYGRLLMGSFRTTKTTVIHEGLRGTFAFEEQFANIETLRLFQDDGVATPGAQGGVLALMHISSNFGEGWARWWMNCSRQKVRVKADGPKHARLKGIDISVVKPGQMMTMGDKLRNKSTGGELQKMDTETLAKSAGKPVPVKRVTGIRVEFKDEEERDSFLDMSGRVQSWLIPLPSLGGS